MRKEVASLTGSQNMAKQNTNLLLLYFFIEKIESSVLNG